MKNTKTETTRGKRKYENVAQKSYWEKERGKISFGYLLEPTECVCVFTRLCTCVCTCVCAGDAKVCDVFCNAIKSMNN